MSRVSSPLQSGNQGVGRELKMAILDGLNSIDFSGLGDDQAWLSDAITSLGVPSSFSVASQPEPAYNPYVATPSAADTSLDFGGKTVSAPYDKMNSLYKRGGINPNIDAGFNAVTSFSSTRNKFTGNTYDPNAPTLPTQTGGGWFGDKQSPLIDSGLVRSVVKDVSDVADVFRTKLTSLFSPSTPLMRVANPTALQAQQKAVQTTQTPTRTTASGPSAGAAKSAAAPGSFTQDFNAVTNGILQVLGVVAANKQAKQQARGASGPRGDAGAQGSAGGGASNMNYYLIGGGLLVAGVVIFAATRK